MTITTESKTTVTATITIDFLKDFLTFLDTRKALMSWMKNIESDKLGMIRTREPSFWIRGAFIWSNTKEGSNYWNDLANQWERYLKSLVEEAELKVKQKYGTFDALNIDWDINQED